MWHYHPRVAELAKAEWAMEVAARAEPRAEAMAGAGKAVAREEVMVAVAMAEATVEVRGVGWEVEKVAAAMA